MWCVCVCRKAIYKAYERCESMRARLVYDEKEKQWYQYIVDKEEREIEYVDFTGKTMEEAEAEMTAWTRIPFGGIKISVQLEML